MSKGIVIAVDIGTQSVRAVAIRADGTWAAKARKLAKPYVSPQPTWAEVPSEQYWEDCCSVLRDLGQQLGPELSAVRGLTLTANRDAIMPLDAEAKPLRPWIIWADQRRCPEALLSVKQELGYVAPLVHLFGKEFYEYIVSGSKFNWIKHNQAEIYAQTSMFCSISGYLHLKLTDSFVDSKGMQAGIVPFEAARLDWYKLPQIYTIVGVERRQLPELFDPGQQMGTISSGAAAATGLPCGLPVIASGGDKQCETLGAGCFSPSQATISYGTMASIALTSSKYFADRKSRFHVFPSSLPGAWNPEFQAYRGYWLVTWFCQQYAQEGNLPAFLAEMNAEAAEVPPGANGLFVFPYWTPHRALYPFGKGAIVGWEDHHQPRDLYRAIMESVAFALRQGLELMERKSRHKVDTIFVTGGGSQSDAAMQLTADIFNVPCHRLSSPEVSASGAAICAGVALGIFPNLEQALSLLAKADEVFLPQAQASKHYHKLYKQAFLPFYKHNRKLLQLLSEQRDWDAES